MQKARRHPSEDGLRPLCKHTVSGTVSLPLSGCFSSFTRVTGSLSVVEEYLGLEGGPPMFRPGFTSPDLLEASPATTLQDYHLLWSAFHRLFTLQSG